MYCQITFKEAQRILLRNGFKLERVKGSHYHYIRNGKKVIITTKPHHLIWQRLVKENGLIF